MNEPKPHPESYKAYLIRRIDRLYQMADQPANAHERRMAPQYLEEIKYLMQNYGRKCLEAGKLI